MSACVVGLYSATAAGVPVLSRSEVTLLPGVGIDGDRYAEHAGHWSDLKWPDQELTLIDADVAADLGVEPGALRRNIVTRGVLLEELIGVRFRLGEALIEGVRPCDPCHYLETLLGRPGLTRALAGRGGLRARVIEGGRVALGDELTPVGEPSARAGHEAGSLPGAP